MIDVGFSENLWENTQMYWLMIIFQHLQHWMTITCRVSHCFMALTGDIWAPVEAMMAKK